MGINVALDIRPSQVLLHAGENFGAWLDDYAHKWEITGDIRRGEMLARRVDIAVWAYPMLREDAQFAAMPEYFYYLKGDDIVIANPQRHACDVFVGGVPIRIWHTVEEQSYGLVKMLSTGPDFFIRKMFNHSNMGGYMPQYLHLVNEPRIAIRNVITEELLDTSTEDAIFEAWDMKPIPAEER